MTINIFRKNIPIIVIVVFLLILSFLNYFNKREFKDGEKLRITTKVLSEPKKYSRYQGLNVEGFWIYVPLFPEITYGDEITVEGVVDGHLLKKAEVIEIKRSKGWLYLFRNKLLNFYKSSIPEPHASLISGMVIGAKGDIPERFWDKLKTTGTAHVVVASGMNVTLVAAFFMNVFVIFLPRKRAVFLALIGIWLYAFLSGFDAPIIRAAVMGSISFGAIALGRLYYAWRGLVISAVAMLIINPAWINDIGFIMSFTATCSLMLFERPIRERIKFIPAILKEGLSTSLSAQIGVAPIIYITFGQFNLLSPIVNAFVLWTVAPITIIGMTAGLVSIISIYLGKLILITSYSLTSWFIWIVNIFS